ncbi:hypothetical protein F4678DRAFT_427416 [Xylaria arbuscula]|nr:hypothetical protein F4678DRAFT_427416 [Xylaria arbuscula]
MRDLREVALPLVVCALGIIIPLSGASSILTFSDRNCGTLLSTIDVKDTTGSGECTRLTSGFKSLMIGTLGDGCSATIYGHDSENSICSATNNSLAVPSVCYNSTWIYFSVDVCAPNATTSELASKSTSTTSTIASATLSTTSTSTPTTTPESTTNGVNIGAVVGGTVSGIFVLALVVGAGLYFFWFRPKHRTHIAELPENSGISPSGNNDSYAINDLHAKDNPYTTLSDEPQVYELSPQYIAEVHGQTHERHELPP